MPYVNHYTELGAEQDAVSLWIEGKRVGGPDSKAQKYTRYQFTRSIFKQPSTFSYTIGSGDLSREICLRYPARALTQLKIGETTVFTGMLEDVTIGSGSGATEVTFQGRDMVAPLVKTCVLDEHEFTHATYFELTKAVMKIVGYPDPDTGARRIADWLAIGRDEKLPACRLIAGNEANRRTTTRTKATAAGFKVAIEEELTNLTSRTGDKIKYQKVVGKIGQTWFEFLTTQFKKIGLYLWCAGDGDLILSRPTANIITGPLYQIERYRGQLRTETAAFSPKMNNRTSGRHAMVRVYGKGRPDKHGQRALYGDEIDVEMYRMGFRDILTIHDNDCKTVYECQYRAKRQIADERKANRTLMYPVSGHTTPSLSDPTKMAIWAPDTTVRVRDNEIAWWGNEERGGDARFLDEIMYIETVEMVRDASGTKTNLTLLRDSDLYYLGEMMGGKDEYAAKRNQIAKEMLEEIKQ